MYADKLDTLGKKLADTALTLLVRLYPEVRQASTTELDAACAAMRAKSRSVIDELIDDAKDAPGVAHIAFQTAALAKQPSLLFIFIKSINSSRWNTYQ